MNGPKQLIEHPLVRRVRPWLPLGLVTLVGLVVLWPIPLGRMPLSLDHTVHLTRIWLWGQELASGSLRGWSPVWFFGSPVGELYPVAGDALILAVRALSLGLAEWSTAYALGFTVVFLLQGWAMVFAARRLGLGRVAATAAGILILTDVGQYREGGWIYTVQYGVWPQALGTALLWWGLAELAAFVGPDSRAQNLGRAGLLLGAAILAHPMTLPVATCGGLILVAAMGARNPDRIRTIVARATLGGILGLCVAVWWLVPMLQHRAWMASYGWLFMPLDVMVRQASHGALAKNVVTPVTLLACAGMAGALLDRRGGLRFVAGTSLILWFLASSNAFWSLRLDRVSEGFTHLQYQRFLAAAKPGFFLLAGASLGFLARFLRRGHPARRAAVGVGLAGLVSWTAQAQWTAMSKAGVGTAPISRFGSDHAREEAYDQLKRWLANTWAQRQEFWRVAVRAPRNVHWFMDAPVGSGLALYKMGFTPGDNFVHKPESRRREVLDALGVRYVIQERKGPARPDEIQRFGAFAITEHPGFRNYRVAWLRGPGTVDLTDVDLETGRIAGTMRGVTANSQLVFGVAGYPRWELRVDDEVVEWGETPVWGDAPDVTGDERGSGRLRGGKVHGDDGTEPTLITAPATGSRFELVYRSTRPTDVLALLVSLAGLALCLVAMVRPTRVEPALTRAERGLARASHPLVIGALIVAVTASVGFRWLGAADREASQATAWVAKGRARVEGSLHAGPLKTNMLIRPCVRARPGSSHVVFPALSPRAEVAGWVALDDDSTKLPRRGSWTLTAEIRTAGGAWRPAHPFAVPHRPGQHPLRIPGAEDGPFDLRITVRSTERPPPLGFDLALGVEP